MVSLIRFDFRLTLAEIENIQASTNFAEGYEDLKSR